MQIKQIPSCNDTLITKENYSALKEKTTQNLTKKTDQTCEAGLKHLKQTHNYHLNTLVLNSSNVGDFVVFQLKYFKHKIECAIR